MSWLIHPPPPLIHRPSIIETVIIVIRHATQLDSPSYPSTQFLHKRHEAHTAAATTTVATQTQTSNKNMKLFIISKRAHGLHADADIAMRQRNAIITKKSSSSTWSKQFYEETKKCLSLATTSTSL